MLRRLLELLKDTAAYGVSGALSQLINFLLLPLYTRFLTPADYGVMAMLTIVGALYEPLARMGMLPSIFRFFSLAETPEDQRTTLSTGAVSVVVSTALLLVVALAGADLISLAIGGTSVLLIRLTLVSSSFSTLGAVPFAAMRAARRTKMAASFNVARLLAAILASVVFVVWLQLGVLGVVLGTLIGESLAAVAMFVATRSDFQWVFDRARWKAMFSWGLPFVPHHLQAVGVDFFGIYLVGAMLGIKEAGLYNVAVKLAIPLSFVVNTIQKAWGAYKFHVYKVDSNPKQVFRSIVTYYFAGISYLWVGIAVWSPELLRLMTTPQFHDAGPLIAVVAIISITRGMYFMAGTGLEFSDNVKIAPLISLAGLVTIVIAGYTLTSEFGPMGAAIGSSLSWAVMAALLFYFAHVRFPIDYDWVSMACLLGTAVAFVLVGHFAQGLLPVARIAVGLVLSLAYPAVALLILSRSPTERERIMHLIVLARRVRSAGS